MIHFYTWLLLLLGKLEKFKIYVIKSIYVFSTERGKIKIGKEI